MINVLPFLHIFCIISGMNINCYESGYAVINLEDWVLTSLALPFVQVTPTHVCNMYINKISEDNTNSNSKSCLTQ